MDDIGPNPATKEALIEWFKKGKARGKTHMIVVCDTFGWSDYPVYVAEGQDPHKVAERYDRAEMQEIMEVYDLRRDMDEQINAPRTFSW